MVGHATVTPEAPHHKHSIRPTHRFNAPASSTITRRSGTFQVQSADKYTVSGPYTVTLSRSLQGHIANLLSCGYRVTQLCRTGFDGILHSRSCPTSERYSPFFNTLLTQKVVPSGVFGFKLAKTGSELYFGGTDASLYSGPIKYHTVTGTGGLLAGLWCQYFLGHKVSNRDSKLSLIRNYSHIGTAKCKAFCQSIPGSKVSFTWDGKMWTISAASFTTGISVERPNVSVCFLAGISDWEATPACSDMRGSMKNVYTAFSFDQNSVGFATLN
ncbi:Cathepsin D [Grifola frondosa]|uniref:Cathepsin D n=1 Tax=Grifola frondosa TaxID=5627 RepID=A0A1C7LU62_GRIFR|nr:Cathepsin D [Grifola frondosa]